MSQSYGRILFVLAGIALAVYFAWKIAQRVDAFFFPWANEKSGRPVLTGAWVGTFTPPEGDTRVMQMELHRWREDRDHPCADCQTIEGVARTCDADATVVAYRVSGAPLDRTAKRIRLRVLQQGDTGSIDNEVIGATGEWQGASLRLTLRIKDAKADTKMEMARASAANWKSECEALARS